VKVVINGGVTCQKREIEKAAGKEFRNQVKDLSGATIKDLKETVSIGINTGVLFKDKNGYLCIA